MVIILCQSSCVFSPSLSFLFFNICIFFVFIQLRMFICIGCQTYKALLTWRFHKFSPYFLLLLLQGFFWCVFKCLVYLFIYINVCFMYLCMYTGIYVSFVVVVIQKESRAISLLTSPAAGLKTVDPLPLREDSEPNISRSAEATLPVSKIPDYPTNTPKQSPSPPCAPSYWHPARRIQGSLRDPEFQHNGNYLSFNFLSIKMKLLHW